MALFEITVDVSTLATSMYLEYKNVQPDGTFSPTWTTYIGPGTSATGQITLTPPNASNYVISNVTLNDNTVYEFRIKEICQDNTINYSPVDGYPVNVDCFAPGTGYINYTVGSYDYLAQEYPIVVTWAPASGGFNPNKYSIKDYIINITEAPGAIGGIGGGGGGSNPIDHITVPASNVTIPGIEYTYTITSNDLSAPLKLNGIYNISISFTVITETGAILTVGTYCAFTAFQIPNLRTFKIHAQKGWIVDWIDENNVHQRSCNTTPAPNPPSLVCESPWILVHHRTNPGGQGASNPLYPICGYCATSGAVFPVQYNFMYVPNPTVYTSDRVNCYPVTAGVKPNPSIIPCDCGDVVTNTIKPSWGASWELIGAGYVTLSGTTAPPVCNVTAVCTNAPSW